LICVIFATFLAASGSLAAASGPDGGESVCVPIIMYHQVKTFNAGKDVILPWEFENDLKYLSENNYITITMSDLIDYVYNGKSLPEKPVILTFDDGYLNNYVYVYPLLKEYNMKIVFSIIGKNIDDFTNIPDDNIDYSHVTWDQLCEMLDSGCVEVQNHTYNLHNYSKYTVGCAQKYGETFMEYEMRLNEDIGRLQEEIIEMTGRTPNTFAYPFGKYCDEMDEILKKLGFKASLTCDYGVNVINMDDPDSLFSLKRICRSHGQGIEKLIKEGLKTVR